MGINIPDSLLPKDSEGRTLCLKCQALATECACPVIEPSKPKKEALRPVIRMERSGRKGKTVTVITRLPRKEEFLKDLSKAIKTKTGSGGTFYQDTDGGVIEVQGDHRNKIESLLKDFELNNS